MQALCVLQDRQVISQQQTQQYNPYYNLSTTNACTLQTVSANSNLQLPNQVGPYTHFSNNQLPLQLPQLCTNPTQNAIQNNPLKENQLQRNSSASVLDFPSLTYSRNKLNDINKIPTPAAALTRSENPDWPPPTIGKTFNIPSTDYKDFCSQMVQTPQANSSSRAQEERFSDESSVSFDFTIEAEKMVSALCNTASTNDLGKIEISNNESSILFSGAGDNVSCKETWFPDYSINNATAETDLAKNVATQTQEPNSEKYPELIRKTTLWGCNQAENLLNSAKYYRDSKHDQLTNLAAATRTAITKSSTCFPVYAGDGSLVQDLINSLLRISNGWLILDNYLNKQHFPSLSDKYDHDLLKSFHEWEVSTHELLENVIKTFLQLDEKSSNLKERIDTSGTFPGDVSIYTNYDLFQSPNIKQPNLVPGSTINQEPHQNFHYFADHKKETKLRGKWTITENVSAVENNKNLDVSVNRVDAGIHVSRFRTKGNVSSIKSTSLNAEFFHLRNKVLENKSAEVNRQWHLNERKKDVNSNKPDSKPTNMDSIFRLKFGNENRDTCSSQCLSRIDPIYSSSPGNTDLLYANTSGNSNYSTYKNYADLKCISNDKRCIDTNPEINLDRILSTNAVYMGKSSTEQMELSTIPVNKMTLLSQIEPNTAVTNKQEEMTANLSAWFASMRNMNITTIPNTITNTDLNVENPSRSSVQEGARSKMDLTKQLQLDTNCQLLSLQNMQSIQSAPWNACNLISNQTNVQKPHDEYDSSEDVRIYMKPGSYNVPKKRHQRKANRRSENTSSRLGIRHSNKDRSNPTTYFSASRLVTVNNADTNTNSNIKITFPTNPLVSSSPNLSKTSSRILQRSSSPEDMTWKAACASAEILLEALHVKGSSNFQTEEENRDRDKRKKDRQNKNQVRTVVNQKEQVRDKEKMDKKQGQMFRSQDQIVKNQDSVIKNQGQKHQRRSKSRKQKQEEDCNASSYEASEDDSEPSYKVSHIGITRSSNTKLGKSNVKTDSWLIRTLNNASIIEQPQSREDDLVSSDSLNSSVHEDEQSDRINVVARTSTTIATDQVNISSRENFPNFLKIKEGPSERFGKATYSETVRRSTVSNSAKQESCKKAKDTENDPILCGTILPLPGKKGHRKDVEKSYPLQKSKKSAGKKTFKDQEIEIRDEENLNAKFPGDDACLGSKYSLGKGHGKKKNANVALDGKNKTTDKGWSVWYSSKKKQMLSPSALSKLEAIHQTVWQMDEACVFKHPSSAGSNISASSKTVSFILIL